MSTDVEVDDFLAHFGVKGMRWGHHNAVDDDGGAPRQSRMTEDQKRRLKTAAKVAGTVAVIGGIVAAAYLLQKSGKIPTHTLSMPSSRPGGIGGGFLKKAKGKLTPERQANIKKLVTGAKMTNDLLKSGKAAQKPPPKLDPDIQKFLDDSAKRQAADNAMWKAQDRKFLNEVEQDPFVYNYLRGKNPEMMDRVRENSR